MHSAFLTSFGTLNFTRRTNGHCLGTFRAVNVSDSPRDDDDDYDEK